MSDGRRKVVLPDKYCVCLSFDRAALVDAGHPLNIATNGVFVTDKTIPAHFIDRIYILQNGEWVVYGLAEVMSCRVTGNEGGTSHFSRSPAQTEVEDKIRRAESTYAYWESQKWIP